MVEPIHYLTGKEYDTKAIMSDAKFYESYSRWEDSKGRYETWEESVSRVMNMHRAFYKDVMGEELSDLIDEAEESYKQKYVLGAQRALQFGGDQLLKHHMRLYNCTSSYLDRDEFFGELFYVLLCGAGAGFSVQKHHVAKLSKVAKRTKQAKVYIVKDSIEGWADAVNVLMSSFFVGGGKFPEFEGRRVFFEMSNVRGKGSLISGGFKAPGPEPLRQALNKIEHLIQTILLTSDTLRPIHTYDISMFIADAVLAGGVRRSATICLFSPDDEEMATAKTGNWFEDNPQRARSNNSALIVRDSVTREEFSGLMTSVREFGEPGFVFTASTEHSTNPCVEIGMFPQIRGISGWQGCNLVEINGAKASTKEEFFKACRAGAILGTLQAGYTDFKFLPPVSKEIFDREALLGVSVTGWMNNPEVLLVDETQRTGAGIVQSVNKQLAALININPAARSTCVKPAGNASVILMTASGIHAEDAPKYLRHVQMNKESEVAQLIHATNPYMVEESIWSANNSDYVIAFPVISKEGSIFKSDTYGINLLERVKQVQQNWVEYGTDESLCQDPTVRHNVSNTVSVKKDQWAEVEDYVFENRYSFAGISFLSATGARDYFQAPNTEVLTEEELVRTYGRGSMFASGLIVDVMKGFNNLWEATSVAQQPESRGEVSDIRADWIRRFHKFSKNYFAGDQKKAEYCLKDVYNLHKWTKIQQHLVSIDFVDALQIKSYTDINTMGAMACAGGFCEI